MSCYSQHRVFFALQLFSSETRLLITNRHYPCAVGAAVTCGVGLPGKPIVQCHVTLKVKTCRPASCLRLPAWRHAVLAARDVWQRDDQHICLHASFLAKAKRKEAEHLFGTIFFHREPCHCMPGLRNGRNR